MIARLELDSKVLSCLDLTAILNKLLSFNLWIKY